MGNLSSINDDGDEGHVRSKAERWALAKRCVALLQVGRPHSVAVASAFFAPLFGNHCLLLTLIYTAAGAAHSESSAVAAAAASVFLRNGTFCHAALCVNRPPHTIHSPLSPAFQWVALPHNGACLNPLRQRLSTHAPPPQSSTSLTCC